MAQGPQPIPLNVPIQLRRELEEIVGQRVVAHAYAQRARIILLAADGVSVSNCLSRRHRELDQPSAVRNPTHLVEFGAGNYASVREG